MDIKKDGILHLEICKPDEILEKNLFFVFVWDRQGENF
jgi:hypothetical protein